MKKLHAALTGSALLVYLLNFAAISQNSNNITHLENGIVPVRNQEHEKRKAVPFKPDPDEPKYTNNFDVSTTSTLYGTDDYELSYIDYSNFQNQKLGKVKKPYDNIAYHYHEYVTYKSHWVESQPAIKTRMISKRFETFYFNYYVSVPIKIIDKISLERNTSVTYTLQTQLSASESQSKIVENGNSIVFSYLNSAAIELGMSIKYMFIKANGSLDDSSTIGISDTLNSQVSNESTKTTTFTQITTQTYQLENSTNQRLKYQFNYRMKFRLYFVTEYDYQYDVARYGSGTFYRDDNFKYTMKGAVPVKTTYFLMSVGENPAFECTKYIDDLSGHERAVNEFENNVLYI